MSRGPRTPALLATVVAVVVVALPARAGSFFEDGSYAFDPAAVLALDFEDGLPPPADPDEPPNVRAESDSALSGDWVVALQPNEDADFLVELPPVVGSYRASLWVRDADAFGFFGVIHGDSARVDEIAVLYPTGRMTSDGWIELANQGLRVDGARSQLVVGAYSPTGGELDAIEVVPDGVVVGPVNPDCQGIGGSLACGVGQLCIWGECRNVNGWVPPIPADREEVTDYLENRLRFLFGPYLERTLDLPNSLVATEQMRSAADPWTFWNGFLLAVRRLHDGHTSTNGVADMALKNPWPIDACFVEGLGDASQETAPSEPGYHDVLVSHVGPDRNLGLGRGDRLVRVDGEHPIAWARGMIEVYWSHPAVSNHTTFAEHAAALPSLISRFAHEIEVVRCDPQSLACGPLETISIDTLAPIDPHEPFAPVACDNRPLRHVPGAPADHAGGMDEVFHGLAIGTEPDEKIHAVEWESLYTSNGQDGVGAALKEAVKAMETAGAAGVILDHRKGTGGTMAGPAILWDWAVASKPLTFFQTRQRAEDEQPTLAAGKALFAQALGDGLVDYAGSATPTVIPIALLLTEDVSASDWLPLGLKGEPNVRLFGPYQTNGAFSTRLYLGYGYGMGYSIATGDSFTADGRSNNGFGVEPDELVLPRQSDLVAGKDTVFDAALAWVRQQVKP